MRYADPDADPAQAQSTGAGAGDPGGDPCFDAIFPDAPDEATALVHVAPGCPVGTADGSRGHPYAQMGAAIAAAPAGAAILIAPGEYAERITIEKDLWLVGSSAADAPDATRAVITPGPRSGTSCSGQPTSVAVTVCGDHRVTLRGLRIARAVAAGVAARSAALTIEGTAIEDTALDGAQFGHGVTVSESGSLLLRSSAIRGSAGAGLIARGAEIAVVASAFERNDGGGAWIDRTLAIARIEGSAFRDNGEVGVGVLSARATLSGNLVATTGRGAEDIGDGIYASAVRDDRGDLLGPASVELRDNEITANARVGVLLLEGVDSFVVERNTIRESGARSGFGPGIWVATGGAPGATRRIADNEVTDSTLIGVALSRGTAGVVLERNTVDRTASGAFFMGAEELSAGDGIGLFDGASAQILDNAVRASARFGLIADAANAASTRIVGNTFVENDAYGVVFQDQAVQPATAENRFDNNGLGDVASVEAGTYAVMDSPF